jgi:hypothetical protein
MARSLSCAAAQPVDILRASGRAAESAARLVIPIARIVFITSG